MRGSLASWLRIHRLVGSTAGWNVVALPETKLPWYVIKRHVIDKIRFHQASPHRARGVLG